MPTYVPVGREVEAFLITNENIDTVAAWCGGHVVEQFDAITEKLIGKGINVNTLGGRQRAEVGQYVAKNLGYYYVRTKKEFEDTHLFVSKH